MSGYRQISFAIAVAFSVAIGPGNARGHSRFLDPSPRLTKDGTNRADIKPAEAPCGASSGASAVLPVSPPHAYRVGDSVTVKWEETVYHDGWFILSLSKDGGATFTVLADKLEAGHTDKGSYTHTITLNEPCTKCVLQLIQVMGAPPNNYYSCSDLVVTQSTSGDAGVSGDAASPNTSDGSAPSTDGNVRSSAGDGSGAVTGCSVGYRRTRRAYAPIAILAALGFLRVARRRGRGPQIGIGGSD